MNQHLTIEMEDPNPFSNLNKHVDKTDGLFFPAACIIYKKMHISPLLAFSGENIYAYIHMTYPPSPFSNMIILSKEIHL